MRSLYLRIWLTVVVVLAAFALVSGWMWQRHMDQERARVETMADERAAAWADLLQRSLPGSDEPANEQSAALLDWASRLRLPLALDDAQGQRIATSENYQRAEREGNRRALPVRLEDGRTLWIFRPGRRPPPPPLGLGPPPPRDRSLSGTGPGGPGGADGPRDNGWWQAVLPGGPPSGVGLASLLVALFMAIALGAYPVVRRLTRRLESLKQGVQTFGEGDLGHRVDASGRDEVAAVAASFNAAADKVQALLRSHQNLLANASHELRSPLARLKMAMAMAESASPEQRAKLQREMETNIGELDALVDEVLLSSRLDAGAPGTRDDEVDLLVLAAEEAAQVGAEAEGDDISVRGDERLLRRALRNLLENARRYAGDDVHAAVQAAPAGGAVLRVCDRGPGVPEEYRERIFEPFFRLPGHAEREGGVGLGLSLVKQIAVRHGGDVRCEPREGGGTCFVIRLPARPPGGPAAAGGAAAPAASR
ncbi:signal transduction histidine kinase [Burkholderiales bacterium JOSHI_001]|nr:signal transduction histidine kinase [Burkholderiales bacterium JOSHI_001]